MVLSRKIRKATGCYGLKDRPFISPPEHCNEQEKTRNSECRDTHREDPNIQEPLAHTSEASPAAMAKQHQRSPPGPPVDASSPLGLDDGASRQATDGPLAQQGSIYTVATSISYLHLLTLAA